MSWFARPPGSGFRQQGYAKKVRRTYAPRGQYVNRYGNTRYGKGTYRATGFYNKRYRAPKWAMQNARIANQLGVEKKFTTDTFVDSTVAASWTNVALNVSDHAATESTANMLMIAQGDGQSQRIGRKIMLTNMSCRWSAAYIAVSQDNAPLPTVFRMIWYIDR